MTLLSRIFRNVQVNGNSEKTRPIQIKSLQLREEIDIDQPLSLDVILKERDQLLYEAEEQIASTKEALAQEIEQTKQYVDEQLKTWEEQKIAYQKAAYDEGFMQGLEEGRNKAIADMQQSLSIANETIQVAHENATNYLQQQEQVILELAIRTAERIIGTKLEEEEELFLSVVKRGLKEVREMKEIKLYVSPTYFKLVSNNRDELASIFPVDVPFMIFVDEDMNDTDCYIETNHGRIVVSIDEQLQELRLKLVEILDRME
ncbi:flagellar assembly protein FliH [Bacillus sp. FJAT-22090]|uniref:flagellar assembly protein FliH n=1 Tax=Bacillus sp. FJAT-22090 TaxID=1581038 RepID=UPI0018D1EBC2|nr:flagellar assembly protein FliH [Bacillus sp. FJAT-22090]